jgi:hypothetical protein
MSALPLLWPAPEIVAHATPADGVADRAVTRSQ